MVPKEGHEERAPSAIQCFGQARLVVDVGRHDLRAKLGQGLCLGRLWVARQGAHGKLFRRVVQDGAHQATALCAGCADDGDDRLIAHLGLLV
jgi:hypothetical protein